MKKKACSLVLAAGLGLLPISSPAGARESGQDDQTAAAPIQSRKIVRVVSTSDDESEVEIENRNRVVFVGEDQDFESVIVDGFSRKRGYLGVQWIDLTPELRLHFGARADTGVMISKVQDDSPARRARLEPGDILIAIDGEKIGSGMQLERTISPLADQTDIRLEIVRQGSPRFVAVTIVERERPSIDLGRLALSGDTQTHEWVWTSPGQVERHVIRIDPQGLEDALHELEVRVEKPGFVERFGAPGQSRLELQNRIRELEQRLESLERQLEAFADK